MSKKCVFNEQWLDEKLNPDFSNWVAPVRGDSFSAFCNVCHKTIKLSNMGRQAVSSHSKGPSHLKNLRAKLAQCTVAFFVSSANKNSETAPSISSAPVEAESVPLIDEKSNNVNSFVINDDVTKAEILWSLEVVSKKLSLNSCININQTFQTMFHDSAIASKFTLGKTKACYVINHGLAPYFKECLIADLKDCKNFVICFDESLNKVSQRGQMDKVVRFWDINQQKVSTRYLDSVFLGRATADDLLEKFIEGFPLPLNNLLQVSMDGPNVNLSFIKKLKTKLNEDNPNGKELIDIGVCGLHIVNGAMKTGLQASGWDLHQFLRALYYIFRDSPARRAMYTEITGCKEFPLKFCSVRWLENVSCLTRALLVYDHVKKYVQECSLPNNKQHKFLKKAMEDPLIKCKLAVFKNLASDCECFLRRFQSPKPLVPFLHTHLLDLMNSLMVRCVKPDKLSELNTVSKLLGLDLSRSDNLLPNEKIDIGFNARKLLKESKCSDREKAEFKLEFRKLIVSMIEKLRNKSPLKYEFVRGVTCLDPTIIAQHSTLGQKRIEIVLEVLHSSNRISEDVAEKAKKQYATLCKEAQAVYKLQFSDFLANSADSVLGLDQFYYSVIGSEKPFNELWEVIKICLILSHGNASVESGFSINKSLLVENLLEESLIAQRTVFDGIQNMGGVKSVVISRRLLLSVRASRKRYEDYLERKRFSRNEEEKKLGEKRKIDKEMKLLEEKKKKIRMERELEESALQMKITELAKKKSSV